MNEKNRANYYAIIPAKLDMIEIYNLLKRYFMEN